MDPFSLVTGIAGLLSLTIELTKITREYLDGVKNAPSAINEFLDQVNSLQSVLQQLAKFLDEHLEDFTVSKSSVLHSATTSCQCQLNEFQTRLLKQREGSKVAQVIHRIKWPLSEKENQQIIVRLHQYQETFHFALTIDGCTLLSKTSADVLKILKKQGETLEATKKMSSTMLQLATALQDLQAAADTNQHLIRTLSALSDISIDISSEVNIISQGVQSLQLIARDHEQENILNWLSVTYPSTNHNAACKSREPETGGWFTKGAEFADWKTSSNSFLWLYGIAGCGKTILSSTIIDAVATSCSKDSPSKSALAYFYFDFNDDKKQRVRELVCSIIAQFSRQIPEFPKSLEKLYHSCQQGQQQPRTGDLKLILENILGEVSNVFLVLDALDECRERDGPDELLELIKEIRGWEKSDVRLLVTSRRERDIEDAILPLATCSICIQSALVDADIKTYISNRMTYDPRLKRWSGNTEVREEIMTTLVTGANGMFRWAVCQLDALQNSLRPADLTKALKSLPKTLDDTYARILLNIDEEYQEEARVALQWLAFSARPVSLEEIAEVVSVTRGDPPSFDPKNRLFEPWDILRICSGLVTFVEKPQRSNEIEDSNYYGRLVNERSPKNSGDVRLAHFSVKEYLISTRITESAAKLFRIDFHLSNVTIAEGCLAYLLFFDRYPLSEKHITQFPLLLYAAKNWFVHAKAVLDEAPQASVVSLSVRLLETWSICRDNWLRLCDPDHLRVNPDFEIREKSNLPSLYVASLFGLSGVAEALIKKGADVNAQGGVYGNALQAAASGGHEAVVSLLLEMGADVNAQGGHYGNALQAAAQGQGVHETMISLLLEKGADVNAQGGYYGNALQAAAYEGPEAAISLLLEKGADVNAQGGFYDNALQAAAQAGHETVISLLLERGADVNAQGEFYSNALQAAALRGYETMISLLLEKGADVNAQGGYFGNALQAAARGGHEAAIPLLLEKGADVNAQGGYFGNALQAAASGGHEAVVSLLLEMGADVNAQGGHYGNALQAAAQGQGVHETMISLLLEKGADVNAQGGYYGNALQAAAYEGPEAAISLLLEKGADVNAQGGYYGNALQAAAWWGPEAAISLLLEKRADVNAQGGLFGSTLRAARHALPWKRRSKSAVIKLLLAHGAKDEAHDDKGEEKDDNVAKDEQEIVVEDEEESNATDEEEDEEGSNATDEKEDEEGGNATDEEASF